MAFSFTKKSEITLKKGKAKPFWHQHPWVFSGAIKDVKGKPENGDVVDVLDDQRRFIGKGFYNEHSQIRVRLLSWDLHEKIDNNFFHEKIKNAIVLRHEVLNLPKRTNSYRLIHSEADGLPGLTVDVYGEFLSMQFTSLGMDQRKEMIMNTLCDMLGVDTVIERYTAGYRKLEGMKEIDHSIYGPEPPQIFEVHEYGATFLVNLVKGQKTGFYLDQRENRLEAASFGQGKKVLDAFCYTGGFGVYLSGKGGAKEVTFLDSSPLALSMAETNVSVNHCKKANFIKADAFKKIPEMQEAGNKFDLIVLDPPKVAPDKKSLENGMQALKKLNMSAMKMLPRNGILITCDCSGDISSHKFLALLNKAAIDVGRQVKVFHSAGPGPDHPANPACLENVYLKTLFCCVT